jgi:hypothetical protein
VAYASFVEEKNLITGLAMIGTPLRNRRLLGQLA